MRGQLKTRIVSRVMCFVLCGSSLVAAAENRPDIVWMRGGHTRAAYPLHYAAVGDVFATAGTQVGLGSVDTSIKIWRGSDGVLLRTLIAPVPNGEFSISSDGRYLASIEDRQFPTQARLDLWELETGRLLRTIEPPGTRVGVASFAPNSAVLALTSRNGYIDLYDLDGNRLNSLSVDAAVTGIDFNSDGSLMASAVTDKVVLWERGSQAEYIPIQVFSVSPSHVGKTVISPDGSRIAALALSSSDVYVWRVADGALTQLHDGNFIHGFALSSDGSLVATSGSTRAVKLWSADDGSLVQQLSTEPNWLPAVVFSPDDNRLIHSLYPNELRSYERSPDGLYSFVRPVTGHTNTVFSTAFSPDGTVFASGAAIYNPLSSSGEVKLWSTATGELLQTLGGHNQGVYGVRFASDGNRLASASWDFTVKIWARVGDAFEELQRLHEHTDRVNRAIFSPDDALLVTASKDTSIIIWLGLADGTFQFLQRLDASVGGHTDEVEPIDFSGDGQQLFSGGHDDAVKVWERFPDGHFELDQTLEHVQEVESLAVTSDASRIVAGGEGGDIRIWQRAPDGTYLEQSTFHGHAGAVHSVAIAPNGEVFVTVGAHTVSFWSLEDGNQIVTYDAETGDPRTDGVESVSFSPDGSLFGYGRVDATVVVARTPTFALR